MAADDWFAELNVPAGISHPEGLYNSWYQFWYNTEHDAGNWVAPVITPSISTYASFVSCNIQEASIHFVFGVCELTVCCAGTAEECGCGTVLFTSCPWLLEGEAHDRSSSLEISSEC